MLGGSHVPQPQVQVKLHFQNHNVLGPADLLRQSVCFRAVPVHPVQLPHPSHISARIPLAQYGNISICQQLRCSGQGWSGRIPSCELLPADPADRRHLISMAVQHHHPGTQALMISTPAHKSLAGVRAIHAQGPVIHDTLFRCSSASLRSSSFICLFCACVTYGLPKMGYPPNTLDAAFSPQIATQSTDIFVRKFRQ